MKIIYPGAGPLSCPVFNFREYADDLLASDNITVYFVSDSPLLLPWQLRKIIASAFDGEKVVIHVVGTAQMMACADSRVFADRVAMSIVWQPPAWDDEADLRRQAKYAAKADVIIFTDPGRMAEASKAWGCSEKSALIPAPAIKASEGAVAAGPRLLYQGEITRGSCLEEAVKALAESPDATMEVNGTGKGRWAMPAVKLSRRLGTEERIAWNANDFDRCIVRADGNTLLLVPEPDSDWQQVVLSSYTAQGAIALTGPYTKADILEKLDMTPGDSEEISHRNIKEGEQRSPNDFFDRLLHIYGAL